MASSQTLKDLWPSLFHDCIHPWITVHQFFQQLNSPESFFHTATLDDLSPLLAIITDCSSDEEDLTTWTLDKSGFFSVNSFYKFLIDGGIRCPLYPNFWKLIVQVKSLCFVGLLRRIKFSLYQISSLESVIYTMQQIHVSSATGILKLWTSIHRLRLLEKNLVFLRPNS